MKCAWFNPKGIGCELRESEPLARPPPQRELSCLLYFIFDPQKFQLRFNSTGDVEILALTDICPVVFSEDSPIPAGKGVLGYKWCLLCFIHGQEGRRWHEPRALIKDLGLTADHGDPHRQAALGGVKPIRQIFFPPCIVWYMEF